MRYKDLKIHYGINNHKTGKPAKYDKKGTRLLEMNPDGDWYVEYLFIRPDGTYQQFKERRGLNRVKGLDEKLRSAKNLLIVIQEELDRGYNPLTRSFDNPDLDPLSKFAYMPIPAALTYGLSKKKFKTEETKATYESAIGFWIEAFSDCNFFIKDLRKKHIYVAWEKIREARLLVKGKDYSNKHHVNIHTVLQSVLKEFVKLEVFDVNPAANMEKPKVPKKGKKFVQWTLEELEKAGTYLREHDFRLYVIFKLVLRVNIRPIEILRLKPPDYDLNNGFVKIIDSNSKNGETALVPLDADLVNDLEMLELHIMNQDWYIFSDKQTLNPGPTRLKTTYVSHRWRLLMPVLQIYKYIYALKHTGGTMRLKLPNKEIPAGLPIEEMLKLILEKLYERTPTERLEAVKLLMRHSAISTTKIYAVPEEEQAIEEIKTHYIKF